MSGLLLIAVGGALGSVARYLCVEWVQSRFPAGTGFPWGTLFVNVAGSFVIGLLAGLDLGPRGELSLLARQFLMVGVLGGYTTFSSFSLQTLLLLRSDDVWLGVLNVLVSVALGLFAAWAGMVLVAK